MSSSPPARFVFRCDASFRIGTGHVMRCLALADALREVGQNCAFVSRPLSGHVCDLIEKKGYPVTRLSHSASYQTPNKSTTQYAQWAGVPWEQDAEETRLALLDLAPDWVIVDHYAFNAAWQAAAVPKETRVMWVDDLANRSINPHVLVNPNFAVSEAAYADLVPPDCKLLVGSGYSILRPEFSRLRAAALAKRPDHAIRQVLVAMGGIDLPNASKAVLDELARLPNATKLSVVVALGSRAPARDALLASRDTFPFACRFEVDASDMARLIGEADIVIGAVGGSAWERCVLGVPSLMLSIAENQVSAARALAKAGAARYLGEFIEDGWRAKLAEAFNELGDATVRAQVSKACAEICDGDGVGRILAELVPMRLSDRCAEPADSRRVWEWRYGRDEELFYRASGIPSYLEHNEWYLAALKNSKIHMKILTLGKLPIGYVRIDQNCDRQGLVGICLSPYQRGKGYGAGALCVGHDSARMLGCTELIAEVHEENVASLRLFNAAGYKEIARDGAFRKFRHVLK